MANQLYTDTEIKGKLEVDGEVTFTGAAGNGKIIHSTYPNAARIRVQNADQSTSVQLHETGIYISGNGASHYIDDSQVYYSFGENDEQGNWQSTNFNQNSSQVYLYAYESSTHSSLQITSSQIYGFTHGYISFNANNVGKIEMNNYQGTSTAVLIKSDRDNLRLQTSSYYSNLSTSTLTANRRHELPDENGTLATREWVLQKINELLNMQSI